MKKKVKNVEKLDTEISYLISIDINESVRKSRENQEFLYELIKFIVPSSSIIFFALIWELRAVLLTTLIISGAIALKKAFQKEPQLHLFFPRYKIKPGQNIKIRTDLSAFQKETYCLENKNIEVIEDEIIPEYEIINQIKKELEILYTSYKLPDFNINNRELLTIIRGIEPEFVEKDVYKVTLFLIRMILAKSLKEGKKEINIDYIVNNVNYVFGPECDYNDYIRLKNQIKELIKNNKKHQKTLKK